ncbi:MAG: LysR family transcriptional regulator [Acidobacteriota bacterium]|nr:LysR family transcriptional regulator [Acidobacteriota bacterium]
MARRRRISTYRLFARLRVLDDHEVIILGPGKADLLEALARSGSIRDAAAELGMSYMRAWTLIRIMNERFREPLVEAVRGGSGRGGAALTPAGKTVLRLYRSMSKKCERASASDFRELHRLLR